MSNTVSGNTSARGGAIYMEGGGALTMYGCTVGDNHAEGIAEVMGGGLYVQGGRRVSLYHTHFVNNSLDVRSEKDYYINREEGIDECRCLISMQATEVGRGGGTYVSGLSGAAVRLMHCSITGNRITAGDDGSGGGLHVTEAVLSIADSRINDNQILAEADLSAGGTITGGGLYYEGTAMNVTRTRVASNQLRRSPGNAAMPNTAAGGGKPLWCMALVTHTGIWIFHVYILINNMPHIYIYIYMVVRGP